MSDYRKITLVTRNAICKDLTSDEFVKMMFADFIEAEEKYNEAYIPEFVERAVKSCMSSLEYAEKRARTYAEKKWKTQKKQDEYVKAQVEEAKKKINWHPYFYSLSFFDFDVEPWRNGLSGSCCISYKELTPRTLERCFEAVRNNKYFKKALGWRLTYGASETSVQSCFRPQIELILNDEDQAAFDADAKALADDIARFYANCSYPGD